MSITWIRIKPGYDAWLRTQCASNSQHDGTFVGVRGFADDGYVYVARDNVSFSVPARFLEVVVMDEDFEHVLSSGPLSIEGIAATLRTDGAR